MGKASMCIKMLQILNTGRVYKISELANLLDTNPRNIIEYKKELEECYYYITTIPGKYGGYRLDKQILLPTLNYSDNELETLNEGTNYLLSRNDFPNKNEYVKIISKIYSTLSNNMFAKELNIINRYPLVMPEEEISKRYDIIQTAIIAKKAIHIKYISQKNKEKDYIYHPYDLFMYNNAWFVIGWCEEYTDVLYFKLNRISFIEITNKSFTTYKYYNISDYINEYGFKNNGEWYHVEFIATGIYASLVKERIYGKNQEVIPIDEKSTLVKVDMQNKANIETFILGFGSQCKVLEPKWLIEQICESVDKIKDLYIN